MLNKNELLEKMRTDELLSSTEKIKEHGGVTLYI